MNNRSTQRPQPVSEIREKTRQWLNYVCEEFFDGNVRKMAVDVGYDPSARSRIDRMMKGETKRIDDALVDRIESYIVEEYGKAAISGPTPEPVRVEVVSVRVQEQEDGYEAKMSPRGEYVLDSSEIDGAEESDGSMFMVEMVGDTMEPEFTDGDRLLITEVTMVETIPVDGVYLFRLEDTIQVKRLQRLPNQRIRVICANDRYPVFVVDLSDGPDFEVLGAVWGRFERY